MSKSSSRTLRQKRIRSKVSGTAQLPRLNVFRSNRYIYGSLIDDTSGMTLVSVNDGEIKKNPAKNKTEKAFEIGLLIGEKAKKKKINEVVFDRAGYKYHGRVKSLAEGARKGGLSF